MENFTFQQHLKTRRVTSTSQMLCLLSMSEQAPLLLFITIGYLELQDCLRKMSNIMKKKEEKIIKENKVGNVFSCGSHSHRFGKFLCFIHYKHATTSAACAAAIAALLCVPRALSIQTTPPKYKKNPSRISAKCHCQPAVWKTCSASQKHHGGFTPGFLYREADRERNGI